MGDTWDLNRIGVVAAVDYGLARVRVHFEDLDDYTSDWLPVVQRGAGGASGYWMPAIGEQVLCAFRSDGTEDGYVVGSFYSARNAAPAGWAAGLFFTQFPDGSLVKWNNGSLEIVATGNVSVTGDVAITGDLDVSGALQVGGDVNVTGIVYAADFVKTS